MIQATKSRPGDQAEAAPPKRYCRSGSEGTPARLFDAMIDVDDLHRIGRAWVAELLRCSRADALELLGTLRRGDLPDARLHAVTRAAWHAVQSGEAPTFTAVVDAALRHRVIAPEEHPAFAALVVDLLACPPPRRSTLDAATAPAHMARSLRARGVHR